MKNNRATLSGKGQITLPIEIRRSMGLKDGDLLEFAFERGVGTFKRHTSSNNPFEKWAGKLGGMKTLKDVVQWQRNLRDEE